MSKKTKKYTINIQEEFYFLIEELYNSGTTTFNNETQLVEKFFLEKLLEESFEFRKNNKK